MKPRGGGGGGANSRARAVGGAPADLLVCFPSRPRLALLPRAICSPSRRPSDQPPAGRAPPRLRRGSPLFRPRPSPSSPGSGEGTTPSPEEPTSPKVTCSGQVKVGGRRCKLLQAGRQRRPRRQHWLEALGFKRDVMHFLAALRGLRLGLACFRGAVDCTTDDDDDDDGDEEDDEKDEEEGGRVAGDVFTRWFMHVNDKHRRAKGEKGTSEDGVPPANAMVLMWSRSAPAGGWEERRRREEEDGRVELMGYEVVKETWLAAGVACRGGGGGGVLERSRSCRR